MDNEKPVIDMVFNSEDCDDGTDIIDWDESFLLFAKGTTSHHSSFHRLKEPNITQRGPRWRHRY